MIEEPLGRHVSSFWFHFGVTLGDTFGDLLASCAWRGRCKSRKLTNLGGSALRMIFESICGAIWDWSWNGKTSISRGMGGSETSFSDERFF